MSKRVRKATPDDTQNKPFFIRNLYAKNPSQEHYLRTLKESTITFAIGPAGTAKTFIAAYVALELLLAGEAQKIILTRPMVANEDIGYLPGDLNEKIHPYLLPLVDSIESHIGTTKTRDLFDSWQLEAAPLAYMRGRTFHKSVVILDEAQNATREQMKLFLTRIGAGTKLFINGDVTQSDLPIPANNGLSYAVEKLRGVSEEIAVVEFYPKDIVRHPLIEVISSRLG